MLYATISVIPDAESEPSCYKLRNFQVSGSATLATGDVGLDLLQSPMERNVRFRMLLRAQEIQLSLLQKILLLHDAASSCSHATAAQLDERETERVQF